MTDKDVQKVISNDENWVCKKCFSKTDLELFLSGDKQELSTLKLAQLHQRAYGKEHEPVKLKLYTSEALTRMKQLCEEKAKGRSFGEPIASKGMGQMKDSVGELSRQISSLRKERDELKAQKARLEGENVGLKMFKGELQKQLERKNEELLYWQNRTASPAREEIIRLKGELEQAKTHCSMCGAKLVKDDVMNTLVCPREQEARKKAVTGEREKLLSDVETMIVDDLWEGGFHERGVDMDSLIRVNKAVIIVQNIIHKLRSGKEGK